MIKKGLAVAVILLFIGLALAPSINATLIHQVEQVEITIEYCGLPNNNMQTITMTKNEFKEVESILTNTHITLAHASSIEEASEIVTIALGQLNQYNMFSKQTDINLIIDTIEKRKTVIQKTMTDFTLKDIDNIACFISGKSDKTVALNPFIIGCIIGAGFYYYRQVIIAYTLEKYFPEFYESYINLFKPLLSTLFQARIGFWVSLAILSNFFPLDVSSIIHFGTLKTDYYWGFQSDPATGNITTFGLKGKKEWNGKIWGTACGFTGIRIQTVDTSIENRYLGFALGVYIED